MAQSKTKYLDYEVPTVFGFDKVDNKQIFKFSVYDTLKIADDSVDLNKVDGIRLLHLMMKAIISIQKQKKGTP